MHPIFKEALAGIAPEDEDHVEFLRRWAADIRESSGASVDADKLDAIASDLDTCRQALEQCQTALAMLIEPNAIKRTTTLHAFEQATAAELAVRKALAKATEP